jgi:hypothetical protein
MENAKITFGKFNGNGWDRTADADQSILVDGVAVGWITRTMTENYAGRNVVSGYEVWFYNTANAENLDGGESFDVTRNRRDETVGGTSREVHTRTKNAVRKALLV